MKNIIILLALLSTFILVGCPADEGEPGTPSTGDSVPANANEDEPVIPQID